MNRIFKKIRRTPGVGGVLTSVAAALFIVALLAAPGRTQFWSDDSTQPTGIDFDLKKPGLPSAVTEAISKLARSSGGGEKRIVHHIIVDGMINPASAEYIEIGVRQAAEDNAEVLVISLDTPGGLLESTRTIVKAILNSDVPVVVFVSPAGARAGSAGVFITLAGHIAAMEPGANIGAAHPVTGTGQNVGDKNEKGEETSDIGKKIVNDTVAFVESIATQRKRNVEWAKKAVIESDSITAEKALELNVIDLVSTGLDDLLQQIDGREVQLELGKKIIHTADAEVITKKMGLKHRFIDTLANPNVAYILMMIATLGIYFELSHPGAIFPGVIAAVCLILSFVAFKTLPFNTAGLLLIGISLILFILEVYVTSFGMLTIGGLITFVMGSLMVFDTPGAGGGVDRSLIAAATTAIGLFTIFIGYLVVKSRGVRVSGGSAGLVGELGEARTELSPEGSVFVHGELWNAISEGEKIEAGDKVRVLRVEGLKAIVEKISP